MSRWFALLPLVALAALVGQAAPAQTLPPLEGGAPRPLAVRGPLLINFYASNCAPCVEEAPALMALKSQGVRIIGVAWKDAPDKAQAFLQALGDPFSERFVDRDGRAGIDFGVSGVPETFAVDAHGMIRAKHAGALTPDTAEALIDKAGAPN